MIDKAGDEIKKLIDELNAAGEGYYNQGIEKMSNLEYDAKYDRLLTLEKETGIVFSNSPTQNVGYETFSELPKERHEKRMLSLDKTKDVQVLKSWLGDKVGFLSWKLDGLTVVLTYDDGNLVKAVTRGNGQVGDVITNNARMFENLPLTIPYKGEVVLRGEALIRYSDFERINKQIPESEAKYKNPRNLCSGSVRQLNNRITKDRHVMFYAFTLVKGEELGNSRIRQMEWLASQGFQVVEGAGVTADDIEDAVSNFESQIANMDEPSDGLVLIYDDIAYGDSLGETSKFPRNAIAFKWKDETSESVLRKIEWSASRTGLINPIAIFDAVELEGTTVSRASVHNISILKDMKLGIGDRIMVYKANMIIPQIAENLTMNGPVDIPEKCPVCGGDTLLKKEAEAEMLYCTNPHCPAKMLKNFALLASRNAMNIEGLSESTIEKLVQRGIVQEPVDLFKLNEHRTQVLEIEGLGEKSFENLLSSIEKARRTSPKRLLAGLGIEGIGYANAALIASSCNEDWERIVNLTKEELLKIDGIGEVLADSFTKFFRDRETGKIADRLAGVLIFEEESHSEQKFTGMTFVITGSLNHFSNRKELQNIIEDGGGKVTGSVSNKTGYLINNDVNSNSSKNKKARELGIEIISEEDFIERFGIDA